MSSEKEENLELIDIGALVTVRQETYGILEKCLLPEYTGKTINFADNVKIPNKTVGMVVDRVGDYRAVWYIVLWGGTLGGKKLVITDNKIVKISDI